MPAVLWQQHGQLLNLIIFLSVFIPDSWPVPHPLNDSGQRLSGYYRQQS
ncbi:hypothetical protein [Photorhabdus australis]